MENKIRDRAILVSLHISLPTGRKQDKEVAMDACQRNNATPDSGNFSKLILPKESLIPLKQHVTAAREYYYLHSLSFDDDGRRFVPNAHFLELTDNLKAKRETFETLMAQFLGDYPSHVETARGQLGSLFKEDDYPTLQKLKEKFSWQLDVEPIPSAADLRLDLSQDELETLQRDLENKVTAAHKNAQRELYRRLYEPLSRMVERLSDPENKFRDSLVQNLMEVCEVIPKLSLDDDLELASLVDSARQLTLHAPAVLREDVRVRSDVAKRAQEITERMAAFFPVQNIATVAA